MADDPLFNRDLDDLLPDDRPRKKKARAVADFIGDSEDRDDSSDRVSGPAVGLIVASAFSGTLLFLALIFDVWLLASGAADAPARPGKPRAFSDETAIVIRMLWGGAMLATSITTLIGGIRMKNLRNRRFAQVACILAMVPCLGPCFVLGIPFGIWGIVVLGNPRVWEAFQS